MNKSILKNLAILMIASFMFLSSIGNTMTLNANNHINWPNFDYFEVTKEDLEIYDNRKGHLELVGTLEKGQVYPINLDYGNWHRIQFGDYYGYVLKSGTKPAQATAIKNENKKFSTSGKKFTVTEETTVYDNTSGKLVPFVSLKEGTRSTIATDYGNWWRVIVGGRVGYLLKENVDVSFGANDKYFTVTKDNLEVYDNRTGSLKLIGKLKKGEEFRRVSDYGNWHKIQFGDYYGYVLKSGTEYSNGQKIKNENLSFSTEGQEFTVKNETVVYDNTSGRLVPYITLVAGTKATVATDYGNWWRVIIGDKVGYLLKKDVTFSNNEIKNYFTVTKDELEVYDNRKGYLELIGTLKQGQEFPRTRDYGNWHQIQFGNYYGYVLKSGTASSNGSKLTNENKTYETSGREFTTLRDTIVYDNTSGKLVPYAKLNAGTKTTITSDYGNWWRIIIGGKVGYILKDNVKVPFEQADKYFRTIKDNVPVYDNRTGKLVKIAELPKGKEYKRVSDYGNWHQIQVNDHFGYVLKSDTTLTYGENIMNETSNLKRDFIQISPQKSVKVFEKTSTSSNHFITLEKGSKYKVFNANNEWYGVIFGNRIGYILKSDVTIHTVYDYTLDRMLDIQLRLVPQTDKYRNKPAYVHSSAVNSIDSWTISGTGVAARTEPTTEGGYATVEYRLNSGTVVENLGTVSGQTISGNSNWYKIKYNGKTLYVHSPYLTNSSSLVTNNTANVRSGSTTNSHIYATLPANRRITSQAEVIGETVLNDNKWYQVALGSWRLPTRDDMKSYVDPKLQDSFQFLDLSKTSKITEQQIGKILSGHGILDGKAAAFIAAGKKFGVNEIYLVSHAKLETANGRSQLATGVEVGKNSSGSPTLVSSQNRSALTGIKTVYNMYGIGAYDSNPLRYGAIHAYNKGWFTPETAIIEGAGFVSGNYFKNGQVTLYQMRWNPAKPGTHQYATDIGWAAKQVNHIKNLYDLLDSPTIILDYPSYK